MRSGLVVVVAVLVLSACSAGMRRPHPPRPGEWITCTDSRTRPTIDSVVAIAGIGGGIGAWLTVDNRRTDGGVNVGDDGSVDFTEGVVKTGAVIAIIAGVAYGFSAIYGYNTASRCSELKARYPRGHGASRSRTQPDSASL